MTDLQRDLEEKIRAHPVMAIAIAVGAGALIALAKGSSRRDAPAAKRTASGLVIGGLGSIAMGMIRSAVLEHLSEAAKGWLDPEHTESADPPTASFLEH
jgi:hypothetical protein